MYLILSFTFGKLHGQTFHDLEATRRWPT